MTLKRIVIGTLGLMLALVWSMALLYQQHYVDFLFALLAAAPPLYLDVSSLWSLLELGVTGLLVLPVVGASIAALLGAKSALRVLRAATRLTAVLSSGTLVIYAIAIVPIVLAGGPLLPYGPRINYDLLAAAFALGLQIALLALLRKSGSADDGHFADPLATTNGGPMADKALPPMRRDPQLGAVPSLSVAARG